MKTRLAFALLVFGFLSGCGHLSEKDFPPPADRGARYECLQELEVYGVKRKLPSPRHDYVILIPPPGMRGPEVVNLGKIPAGTVIEIDGLLQQGPDWLSRFFHRVRILGPAADRWAKEDVRLNNSDKLYAPPDEAKQLVLSANYFRRLP